MSRFLPHKHITAHEAPLAQDLFTRIVDAERDNLSDEDKANPRAYLLRTWHAAAEAVMRPVQSRVAIEKKVYALLPERGPFDLDDWDDRNDQDD